MKNERQHAVRAELDQRIPRGPRGGPQNAFRMQVNAYRLHGLSFEESRAKATASVRQIYDPAFEPVILPPA